MIIHIIIVISLVKQLFRLLTQVEVLVIFSLNFVQPSALISFDHSLIFCFGLTLIRCLLHNSHAVCRVEMLCISAPPPLICNIPGNSFEI